MIWATINIYTGTLARIVNLLQTSEKSYFPWANFHFLPKLTFTNFASKRYPSTFASFCKVTKTLLKSLMTPTFDGTFEECCQYKCNQQFKKKNWSWVPDGSQWKLLGPERIKGIVSADRKKRNFISIHEMLFLASKYIFWPIRQQKIKQTILKPVNRLKKWNSRLQSFYKT